jgi:cytochrome b561
MFALVFRRWVTRAFSPERGAAMALLIPVAGAVLFSSAFAMSEWSWRDANVMGLVLSVLMTLVYVIGGAYYVILPMSAITVFLMRKLALALWPQPRVANGEEFWW